MRSSNFENRVNAITNLAHQAKATKDGNAVKYPSIFQFIAPKETSSLTLPRLLS